MNSTQSEHETPFSVIADATLPSTAPPGVRSAIPIPPPPTIRPRPRPRGPTEILPLPVVRNNTTVTTDRQSASDDLVELRRKVQSLKTISRTIRCYLIVVLVCVGLSLISCGLMVSFMSQPVSHALPRTTSTAGTTARAYSTALTTKIDTTITESISTTAATTTTSYLTNDRTTNTSTVISTNTRAQTTTGALTTTTTDTTIAPTHQSLTTEWPKTSTLNPPYCYGHTCYNGGWCDSLDQMCVCTNGWWGDDCTVDWCTLYTNCPVNVECIHEKDSALTYCNCSYPENYRCTTAFVYAWYTAHASRPLRQFTLPNVDPNRFKTVQGWFMIFSTVYDYPNPVRPGSVANFNISSLDLPEISTAFFMSYGSVHVTIDSTNEKQYEHFGANNYVYYQFMFQQMNPANNFTIEFGATDLCSNYICNNGGTCGLPDSCTDSSDPPCQAVCHCVEPYFGPHCDSDVRSLVASNFLPPPGSSSQLHQAVLDLPNFIFSSKADSTSRTYQQSVGTFKNWCESKNLPWLPASVTSICLYMQFLANKGKLTLHSFRAGGATAAGSKKVPVNETLIQKHGRWKSQAVKETYVTRRPKEMLLVTEGIVSE